MTAGASPSPGRQARRRTPDGQRLCSYRRAKRTGGRMDFAVRQTRPSDALNGAPHPVSQRIDKRLGRAGDSGTPRRYRAQRGCRAARREVGLVSSNGQSGLPQGKSGPAPCHPVRQPIDAFPCRSLRRSRRASRQSSATLSVSASGLMVARSSRLGHSGSRLPGHRYESSRHGLAASRPRTPGSGASAVSSPPTKPSSRLGTRHIVRSNAAVRSAPLPVRHPGPRVTAAGRCTPAPSGPATTASQSGQRHASYHPPRPIMSAARHRMLSTPCRARLRAARHYRIPPPGDMARKTPSAASGRRSGSDGALRLRPPARRTPPRCGSSSRWRGSPPCRASRGSPPAGRAGRSRRPSAAPASRLPGPSARTATMRPWAAGSSGSTHAKSPTAASGAVAIAGRPPSQQPIVPGAGRASRADERKRLAGSGTADGRPGGRHRRRSPPTAR